LTFLPLVRIERIVGQIDRRRTLAIFNSGDYYVWSPDAVA